MLILNYFHLVLKYFRFVCFNYIFFRLILFNNRNTFLNIRLLRIIIIIIHLSNQLCELLYSILNLFIFFLFIYPIHYSLLNKLLIFYLKIKYNIIKKKVNYWSSFLIKVSLNKILKVISINQQSIKTNSITF